MTAPRAGTARACLVVAAAFFVTMLGATLPTPIYAFYEQRFGFEVTTVTVIFATYAVGVLAALLLTGRWSDAVGRRPLLIGGLVLSAASDVVFLAAGATWVLLVGRLLSGLSAGIFVGTATAAVIESAPARWTARAPTLATVANIGGLGLGPLVAALLIVGFPEGSQPVRVSFAVHLVVATVLIALLTRVPETVTVEPGARLRLQRPTVPHTARSVFAGAGIAGFAGFAVLGVMTAVSPKLVVSARPDAGPVLQVTVLLAFMASSVVAQVLLSSVSVRTAVDTGCLLLALGALGLALSVRGDSLTALLLSAAVAGVGQGLSFSQGLASVLQRVGPHERAGTSSAYFVVVYLAISLPVVAEGVASAALGVDRAAYFFALGVAALAALALVALLLDQRRHPTDTLPTSRGSGRPGTPAR